MPALAQLRTHMAVKKKPTKGQKPKTQPRYNGKHPGGRPPKWGNPEDFQAAIDAYFTKCETSSPPKPKTIMGLALALDLSFQGLIEYAAKGEYSEIVKRAKATVVEEVEQRLFGTTPTGAIFWLKNHGGYRDQQDHKVDASVSITIGKKDADL